MRRKILFLIFSTLLPATLSGQSDSIQKYVIVGAEDFLTLIRFQENAILLDVRLPFEYRKGHIENSINVPVKMKNKKFLKKISFIPIEKIILIYCESEARSIIAAQLLYDAGYRKIYILEGGIEAWKRKILPLYGKRSFKENR